MKNRDQRPDPIVVHDDIVPGLRRRTQRGRDVSPLWVGACAADGVAVASSLGLRSVTAADTGETYVRFGSDWYALPWRSA